MPARGLPTLTPSPASFGRGVRREETAEILNVGVAVADSGNAAVPSQPITTSTAGRERRPERRWWVPGTHDELIRRSAARQVASIEDLSRFRADLWDSDEELEAFLGNVRAARTTEA